MARSSFYKSRRKSTVRPRDGAKIADKFSLDADVRGLPPIYVCTWNCEGKEYSRVKSSCINVVIPRVI